MRIYAFHFCQRNFGIFVDLHPYFVMDDLLIKNGTLINEGQRYAADIYIRGSRIEKIDSQISRSASVVIDATDCWILPGIIDDQVHFREPGLTHKADIATESAAAAAGGVTAFMDMPNTVPPTLTIELLEKKFQLAAKKSYIHYSFYMGTSNDNVEEVLRTPKDTVCGVKVFMGSSTGNLLVDAPYILERLFSSCETLIATHCEDEYRIRRNYQFYHSLYGEDMPAAVHPLIRDEEACLRSSSYAVDLARQYGTRLHVLHLTTADELQLFEDIPLTPSKRITCEVCVHHLYFTSRDYRALGHRIKCNPAIKAPRHREALRQALQTHRIDVIATDHAPHTLEEKRRPYANAPSGLPLVQHGLSLMLHLYREGLITPERIVQLMCHHPAICFGIRERGFLREGYYADIAIVQPEAEHCVRRDQLMYKCGWSPLEGHCLPGRVTHTIVNGKIVYQHGKLYRTGSAERLLFDR